MDRLAELLPAGPALSREQQIGREGTIEALAERLADGAVLKLFEARRVGKKSTARSALEDIAAGGGIDAEVNLATTPAPADVAHALAKQLAPGLALGNRVGLLTRRVGAAATAGADEAGLILAIVGQLLGDNEDATPAAVLERAVERARGERPVAVLLDEAHVIAGWDHKDAESLGAALRDLRGVGVVVASSERRAVSDLSGDGGALQYVGQRFSLPGIAREDWEHELPPRFAKLNVPIEPEALALLLDSSGGHPYCTMLLAREAAHTAEPIGRVSVTVLQAALAVVERDEAWQDLR